ncbi:MAG: hypothetical protein OEL88_01400 [Sterolibacteriaceae bacterium MAG5]|nr:hypothetical protein [Candidatus Nitricoxidireducens bremensis]
MSDTKSKLIKALLAEELGSQKPPMDKSEAKAQAGKLKELYDAFSTRHVFAEGSLIQWKPGLRNKKKPQYNEPCIVIRVLGEPIYGKTDESGSAYFREPLDLIAGFIDDDDDFVVFHFDSRRFMPF